MVCLGVIMLHLGLYGAMSGRRMAECRSVVEGHLNEVSLEKGYEGEKWSHRIFFLKSGFIQG